MAEEQTTWTKLVRLAQQGNEVFIGQLADEAKEKLRAYAYRVTLDHDLANDLSQGTLLEMVKSIDRLNKAECFWPWLYRIAQRKIQQHYKAKQRKTSFSESAFYKDFLSCRSNYHQADGLHQLLQNEQSQKVMIAMKLIKQRYRAVLSLRCFEQLSYSDIGLVMECREVTARVLFFRAKQALKKQLAHQGLSKNLLLMCLGLFGRLTTPAKAASSTVTVTAASTKVGLTTAVLATASSKFGIATVTVAVIGFVSVIGMSALSKPALPSSSLPPRAEVKSLHFTTQLQDNSPAASSLSKGAYEQLFYFPEGIDGPMLMRMQRWNPKQEKKLCTWLEDAQANYYYYCTDNQLHINNYRVFWSSLRVRRLPTDTTEFTSFLSRVEGGLEGFSKYIRDPNTGLLTNYVDYRFVNAPDFWTDYRYNTVGPERFQYDWPDDIPVIDKRDQMHKRGWTYFRINGEINKHTISATGQIPFVYNASKEHPAWMRLKIGNKIEIIDCNDGACLRRIDGIVIAAYRPGIFFKGLLRPWMGMHTLDTVRRDAVAQRVWFNTEPAGNETDVIVALSYENERGKADLIYTIDKENDVIKDIRFDVNGETKGLLVFSYFQDVKEAGDEFVEPAMLDNPQAPIQQSPGIRWLIHLAQGNLGE